MAKADVINKADRPKHTTVSLKDDSLDKVSLKGSQTFYNDEDIVRVIVEVTGKPVITYATEKGKKVSEIDKATRQKLIKENIAKQKAVKSLIKAAGISMKELKTFENVLNGFSIETAYKNIRNIKNLSGVTHVSVANTFGRPEPEMENSKDIVNAVETWMETGYDGEGMVVAIIDTGVDPSHKDMILTDTTKAKLTQTSLNGLPGTYRTAKVPYGYNYMDNNQEILDLGPEASEHGMHVAGTVGANGDPENGGIKGVAPEAQLLAMKVFGNNPAMSSTFGDVIVAAIDDSVELGADVINMSLGSTASYVQEDDLEQVAIRNAMNNGVISAVSAGNSGLFGNGWDDPFDTNPDIGVVGSPGLASESIQVASIENTIITATALEFVYGEETVLAAYSSAGPKDPKDVFTGEVEYLYAGLGKPEEFVGDFTGKIALIERGELAFVDKIANASKAGAAGVIVYNNAGDGMINMAYPSGVTIPAVFIGQSYGVMLKDKIEAGTNFVAFNGNMVEAENPNGGKMSDFTSWGTTPNLDFKPEITAPGGGIWSTAQNNGYQSMSGTSMAAPHVAGGSALVLQRVNNDFNLAGAKKIQMAKNLLMSTAVPHNDMGLYNNAYKLSKFNFTSPRRQGAGVMDLLAATLTPAVAYEKTTGESKVSLGEIGNMTTFSLIIENLSDVEVTYIPRGTVQTDLSDDDDNYLESQGVYIDGTLSEDGPNGFWSGEFPISFSAEEYIVPANGKVEVSVTVDLSNAVEWMMNVPLSEVFENGTFIEGFVTLDDAADTHPSLSIPYMGFYGEWDKAPVVDGTIYNNETTFYGYTALASYDSATDDLSFLGIDLEDNALYENIAFSPNRDGSQDNVIPVLSFLRNAKDFEANILDKDGNVVRKLYLENYLRKNYYDGGDASPYTTNLSWLWDGTVNGKTVKDGEYFYEVRTKVDFEDAAWQSLKFPVKLDTAQPVLDSATYDEKTKTLSVKASDAFSGVVYMAVVSRETEPVINYDGIFDFSVNPVPANSQLVIVDHAGNTLATDLNKLLKKIAKIKPDKTPVENDPVEPVPGPVEEEPAQPIPEPSENLAGDVTAPVVMVTSPEFFGNLPSGNITIEGTVSDESLIEYLRINGQDVNITWDGLSGIWVFTHELSLPDGYHSIDVDAKDQLGNSLAFAHKVFVDSTKPVIQIKELPKTTKLDKITIEALVTDNLPSLKVSLNSNMLVNIAPDWSYFNDLPSAAYNLKEVVQLKKGDNTFTILATDDAGNETVKTVTVKRVGP